jgi:hypothetical protein
MGSATLRSSGNCSDGLSIPSTAYAAVKLTASQVSGRQRGDSDRPVGNNSSGNTNVRTIVGLQIQLNTQAATRGWAATPDGRRRT